MNPPMPRRPNGARLLTTALVAVTCLTTPAAGQARDTVDVLFVGNSYVYYNNLPAQVQAISEALARGPVLRADHHLHGGFSIRRHLDDGHVPGVLDGGARDGGPWDRVVIQEQSTLGVGYSHPDEGILGPWADFHSAAREMVAAVRARGSEPLFYMTWAKEAFPLQTEVLAAAYLAIGDELGAAVAPAGRAWARVRGERPHLTLFDPDGSHPGPAGTYLVACVMYASLTGRSPVGAPAALQGLPMDGSGALTSDRPVTLVSLDDDTAAYLQRVAWETVSLSR